MSSEEYTLKENQTVSGIFTTVLREIFKAKETSFIPLLPRTRSCWNYSENSFQGRLRKCVGRGQMWRSVCTALIGSCPHALTRAFDLHLPHGNGSGDVHVRNTSSSNNQVMALKARKTKSWWRLIDPAWETFFVTQIEYPVWRELLRLPRFCNSQSATYFACRLLIFCLTML